MVRARRFSLSLWHHKCAIYCVLFSLAGISVASGLFIPSLLSGSALGRFIGEVLIVNGFNVDAGTFALIGALLMSAFNTFGPRLCILSDIWPLAIDFRTIRLRCRFGWDDSYDCVFISDTARNNG